MERIEYGNHTQKQVCKSPLLEMQKRADHLWQRQQHRPLLSVRQRAGVPDRREVPNFCAGIGSAGINTVFLLSCRKDF